jgi:DNA invertase Pin-like site-specific DNA recombinase
MDSMAHGNYVAYYRVSTKAQGTSGLGLDAQREAVHRYLNGGDWQLLAEYPEIESGRHDDRPQLAAAMQRCKLTGATLVIAKLDRLSRNVAFLAALMDSGVEFVAVDNPHATRFTLHILAAVAEHERLLIAGRTKAALAAAKARGVVLGGRRGTHVVDHRLGVEARQRQCRDFAEGVGAIIRPMREQGMSLRQIAAQLTADHVQTLRGGAWTPTAVANVLARVPADRSNPNGNQTSCDACGRARLIGSQQ